jgi:hypothetical protein
MIENILQTQDIIDLITRQLGLTMGKDVGFYENYKLKISNEQMFIPEEEREPGIIYIVVKFLPGSVNFGQTVMPVNISAISEENGIHVCQQLLYEFSNTYNLTSSTNDEIKQTYSSPVASGSFSEIYSGFRTVFMLTGTFLYSKHSNPATIKYKGFEVPAINVSWAYSVALNSITTKESNNLTTSKAEYATWTINIATYLVDYGLVDDCMEAVCENTHNDREYELVITFKNGRELNNKKFKLANISGEQPVGNQPVVSITFTN